MSTKEASGLAGATGDYSNYFHDKVSHGSTVSGGGLTSRSVRVAAGTESHARITNYVWLGCQ